MKRETKMAKTKNRIKKMNFQTQSREYEPLSDISDNDKYIIEMIGYQKELTGRQSNEDISRITRRGLRSQHI